MIYNIFFNTDSDLYYCTVHFFISDITVVLILTVVNLVILLYVIRALYVYTLYF